MVTERVGLGLNKLPLFLSSEIAECGLACLAMVGSYLGHQVDLTALRQRFPVSSKGLTLRSVIQIADNLDITTRALKLSAEALPSVPTPCILHWGGNHFVVLKKYRRHKVVIHDPSRGIVEYTTAEFTRNFSGIILEVGQKRGFRKITDIKRLSIGDLWHRNSGYLRYVVLTALLSVMLQGAALTIPLSNRIVIDKIVLSGNISPLPYVFLMFCLIVVFQLGADICRTLVTSAFGAKFDFQLSYNVVLSLFANSIRYFGSRSLGDIVSRVSSADEVKESIVRTYITIAIDLLSVISCFIFIAMFSVFLSGVAFCLSLLSILLAYLTYPAFHQSNSDKVVRTAAEQTHLMESVRGIQTIKMYDLEWERASRWREFRAEAINSAARSQNITGIIESTKNAVAAISTLAIMVIGAREVLTTPDFTIGKLISFLIYVRVFSDRLSSLLTGVNRLRLLGLHLDRLSDAVSQPISDERSSYEYLEQSLPFRGGIELRDIWFRYSPFDVWIFKGASLRIEPGEFISIIGGSGGGKTTLMRIMLGLLQIESGEILIDGKAASPAAFKNLRANAGVVTQDDSLFSGSIRENIVLYRNGISGVDVEAAAQKASIADHIESLPMKYETLIGDMGSSLSAGQKQRVFLARALALNPSLIFLDEGTANLDTENEEHIVGIVNSMSCTRISITHRPAFSLAAAKVYRVDAGQILSV